MNVSSRSDIAKHAGGDVVLASIAHEVRQPLAAIIMSAAAGFRFLTHSPPDLVRAMEAFRRIEADGHRAGAVVDDIRAIFRSDAGARESIDVRALVESVVALERDQLDEHHVRLQVELGHALPRARGNQNRLQQVLLNLIGNAVDAMRVSPGPRVLSVRACEHGRDQVLISISDSGPGVDGPAADRLFDPLFTTKREGMGLGLAICRAIVETHDGKLWFAPNTPSGAVFQFTLRTSA